MAEDRASNRLAPFNPSADDAIETAFRLLQLTGPDDVLLDIGAGDGKLLICAAQRFGCRCVGVEFDPKYAERARERIREGDVDDLVHFLEADAMEVDLDDPYPPTAVFMYLVPSGLRRIRPRLERLRERGVRFVTHMFAMKEWEPTEIAQVGVVKMYAYR